MLSKYISSGKAQYNTYQNELNLSYADDTLIIDKIQAKYQQVRTLNLIHCKMNTLEGIEQFQSLEGLNIKYNDIREVDELLRITNKQNIQRLQFVGNDIQYLGAALFINLVDIFPNLIELNGKNYYSILHKNNKKKYKMNTILANVHKMQKEMQKTIRKQERKINLVKETINNDCQYIESDCLITENRQKFSRKLSSLEKENQEQNSQVESSRDLSQTSKKKYTKAPQNRLNLQKYVDNQIEHCHMNNYKQENDISLSDLSNIPLTRSIRTSINLTNSQIKQQQKKKALEIFTLNESLNNKQANLQPVTATFAMQREKENLCEGNNLMFKNMRKMDKNKQNMSNDDFKYQSKLEYYREKSYLQQSSEGNNESLCSSELDEQNIMYQQIKSNENNRNKAAQAWYYKRLISKIFQCWKTLPHRGNVPMKKSYY